MPRLTSMMLYLSIALLVLGSTHYYLWARLVRDVALPAPYSYAATALLITLGLLVPTVMVMARMLSLPVGRPLMWLTFCWMGLFFIFFCLLLSSDFLRVVSAVAWRLLPVSAPQDPHRRLLIMRLAGGVATAIGLGAGAAALRKATGGPELQKVQVVLRRLPKSMAGFSIAQISDLHVAPLLGRSYVERLVAQTNALAPSLVVITGDLVDGSVDQLRDSVQPLADLKAPHGVFFVTGNHEYYAGVDAWLAHLRTLNIKPLRNERVSIGAGADSFDLVGIDDLTGRSFGHGHGPDLKGALMGRDASRELILLAHQPKAVFEAAQHDVGLMLCGHTHGGQIWPFGYLVKLVQPYLMGLHQHGATQVYVNRGTGYWGPPMRLGVPAELTLLKLNA